MLPLVIGRFDKTNYQLSNEKKHTKLIKIWWNVFIGITLETNSISSFNGLRVE